MIKSLQQSSSFMRYAFTSIWTMALLASVATFMYGTLMSTAESLDRVRTVEEYGTHVFMYVYDKKTDQWNRATAEDLKTAKCKELHSYVIEKDDEEDDDDNTLPVIKEPKPL